MTKVDLLVIFPSIAAGQLLGHQIFDQGCDGIALVLQGAQLRQGGDGIELRHQPRGGPDGPGLLAHVAAQLAEEVVFPLGGPSPQLQNLAFAALECWRHEALLVGQGLPADPVIRHRRGLGPAHRQEIAEVAVVLQLAAFFTIEKVFQNLTRRIEDGDMAAAITLASTQMAVAMLNAAAESG